MLLLFKEFECKALQFSSVAHSCPTLCDPMNRSTPCLPVHHQLLEFTQTHVHRVSDAIQPSHPLSSPSPPAPNPSQHKALTWVNWPPLEEGAEAAHASLPERAPPRKGSRDTEGARRLSCTLVSWSEYLPSFLSLFKLPFWLMLMI